MFSIVNSIFNPATGRKRKPTIIQDLSGLDPICWSDIFGMFFWEAWWRKLQSALRQYVAQRRVVKMNRKMLAAVNVAAEEV